MGHSKGECSGAMASGSHLLYDLCPLTAPSDLAHLTGWWSASLPVLHSGLPRPVWLLTMHVPLGLTVGVCVHPAPADFLSLPHPSTPLPPPDVCLSLQAYQGAVVSEFQINYD